jgi:hypothetical protein
MDTDMCCSVSEIAKLKIKMVCIGERYSISYMDATGRRRLLWDSTWDTILARLLKRCPKIGRECFSLLKGGRPGNIG